MGERRPDPAGDMAAENAIGTGNALRTIYTLRESIYTSLAKAFSGIFLPGELDEGIRSLIDYVEVLGETGRTLAAPAGLYAEAVDGISPGEEDTLEFEYNRLFVGPARLVAPPYESVYLTEDRLVMGETIHDVRRAYREIGLEARNAFREPEDHIAIELEYLARLQNRCLDALEEQDRIEAARMIRLELDFLEGHALGWVPEFCLKVTEGSPERFFRALAGVLPILLETDRELIKGLEAVANNTGEETGKPLSTPMKKEGVYGPR